MAKTVMIEYLANEITRKFYRNQREEFIISHATHQTGLPTILLFTGTYVMNQKHQIRGTQDRRARGILPPKHNYCPNTASKLFFAALKTFFKATCLRASNFLSRFFLLVSVTFVLDAINFSL